MGLGLGRVLLGLVAGGGGAEVLKEFEELGLLPALEGLGDDLHTQRYHFPLARPQFGHRKLEGAVGRLIQLREDEAASPFTHARVEPLRGG